MFVLYITTFFVMMSFLGILRSFKIEGKISLTMKDTAAWQLQELANIWKKLT